MDTTIQRHVENMYSKDRPLQTEAYYALISATDEPVDWAYEIWDKLMQSLTDKDAHVRSIAAQLLSSLAKSDPENRMQKDFPTLFNMTKDPKYITARHSLQSFWKIGILGQAQQDMLMKSLENRFHECINEKNCTLMRYDIIQSMKNVYDVVKDESIRTKALGLIETEEDLKYRKKYAKIWK